MDKPEYVDNDKTVTHIFQACPQGTLTKFAYGLTRFACLTFEKILTPNPKKPTPYHLPNRAAGARVRGSRVAGEGRSPSTGVRVRLVAVGEEREGMQSPADLVRRVPAPDFLLLLLPWFY